MSVTAEQIATKHTEFQQAVTDLATAQTNYDEKKEPYLAAKQTLVDAIARVDALDNELEALTTEYEPPTPPAAQ